MNDKEAELLRSAKPCPFCLNTDLVLANCDPGSRSALWSVGCLTCKAGGPMHKVQEEAVELWNEAKR